MKERLMDLLSKEHLSNYRGKIVSTWHDILLTIPNKKFCVYKGHLVQDGRTMIGWMVDENNNTIFSIEAGSGDDAGLVDISNMIMGASPFHSMKYILDCINPGVVYKYHGIVFYVEECENDAVYVAVIALMCAIDKVVADVTQAGLLRAVQKENVYPMLSGFGGQ